MEIRDTYENLYNESLHDRLRSELSGDFKVSFFPFISEKFIPFRILIHPNFLLSFCVNKMNTCLYYIL